MSTDEPRPRDDRGNDGGPPEVSAALQGALVDEATVRAFLTLTHEAAARALNGVRDPGMLQLVRINPYGGSPIPTRFAIGDVDLMVKDAIRAAEAGSNVYVEGRTVDPRAKGRGKAGATRGVFAFVDDSDVDKGKAGSLALAPSLRVETSPGNEHRWLFLDCALTPEQAEPLGRAIRKAAGSDSATAKLTQPYRVAGTPNYPDARKIARGRTQVVSTRILSKDGPVYNTTELIAEFPPAPAREGGGAPGGRSGATSNTVEDIAAEAGPDRSGRFFRAVIKAIETGMLTGDLEDVFRRHPVGCASKYLEPYDRLRDEIERAWPKAQARIDEKAARPKVDPTYPDNGVPVDEARQAVQEALQTHFAAGTGQKALRVSTGVGKTRIAVAVIAKDIGRRRALKDKSAALYLVPTLRLGDEVAHLFQVERVSARVFRGRLALDPDMPDTERLMCLDPEAVKLALSLGRTVSTSCCKGEHPETGTMRLCPFYNDCAYQRQIRETPDVWVGSHELLFSAPAGLGRIGSVTIDEGFWQAGLRLTKRGLTLDELGTPPALGNRFEDFAAADIAENRSRLAKAIGQQEELGGIRRRHLVEAGIDAAFCSNANSAEWRLKSKVQMWPGMREPARQAAIKEAASAGRVGTFSAVWHAARELLECENTDAVSGRLVLVEVDTEDGFGKTGAVRTCSIKKVLQRWFDVPVLMLDATLPDVGILKQFFPDVEMIADIEAKVTHAHVRQIVDAPISSGKLLKSDAGWNRKAIRRAILHRFVEVGRCSTLVICQLEMETWLMTEGLPAGVATAHFGAIAGLDGFKNVGLLIIVGRTLPNVLQVEADAGALTGLESQHTAEPVKGPRWYDKALLGLRMMDGTGYAVDGSRHPDPVAEAVRWQVAEAGVLQAVGRARGVNRTAENPVIIEIWNDLALPLTVDEVTPWKKVPAGYEADILADGIVVESPSDMAVCWPRVWENENAARCWQKRVTSGQASIMASLYKKLTACDIQGDAAALIGFFRYQHSGARQKWRLGWCLLTVVSDPRTWLEIRLGCALAQFEFVAFKAADVRDAIDHDDRIVT